jgi:BMFP domain-containing protein YqiC
MKIKTSRTGQAVSRAQRIWAELDYVQRRMFELRTGVPVRTRENRRGSKQASF